MSIDFSQLLATKLDDVKRPPLKPPGVYHATISGYKFDLSSQKKTPYVRLEFNNVQPGAEISPDDLKDADGNQINLANWKPSTRGLSDYYFTPDQDGKITCWKLKDLIEGLGIPSQGRSYNETVPELRGQPVLLTVGTEQSQDGNSYFNQITNVAPDK